LTLRRIHCEEIAFHAHERPFVAFHSADKMAPSVVREKLPMNNVNVFACIKDHRLMCTYAIADADAR
jgi:hypothetical protein